MIYKGIRFNGTSYVGVKYSLWLNFNNEGLVFIGQRFLALVEDTEGQPFLETTTGKRIATYEKDENDRVIIDLTDWVRSNYVEGVLNAQISIGTTATDEVGWDLLHPRTITGIYLRNPYEAIIPLNNYTEAALILPPSRMLFSQLLDGDIKVLFCKAEGNYQWGWRLNTETQSQYEALNDIDSIELTFGGGREEDMGFELKCGNDTYIFIPEYIPTCERVALLEWESFVGLKKQHVFKVSEQKIVSANDYSLALLDNAPNAVKGREESLTLYIDELDAYDIWYYSDILTSSSVQLLAADEQLMGTGISVEVVTKNVTIPSGDKADGKIEFEILIKRYDAVAM